MTDAEIVAYNAGVAAYAPLAPATPTGPDLAAQLRDRIGERETAAIERLGEDTFWGWVEKGAWDAFAKVAL